MQRSNGNLQLPDERTIQQLLDWRPELGVISVYVAIDPADRREGWRIELRDRLDEIVASEQDKHVRGRALAATADRIQAHFEGDTAPSGRCQIGFCEVAERDGRQLWMGAQMQRDETEACYRDRAHLTPLLELLDEGAAVGVMAVSAERARLYEWSLGRLNLLEDWEAVLFMPDWRERKAQSTPDPARIHGASSSGHDQFDQRLDANRERFLEQVGGLVGEQADNRSWRQVFAFGEADQVAHVRHGTRKRVDVELADEVNVISDSDHGRLLERVDRAVREAHRRRELDLVRGALDAAQTPAGRGAIGLDDIERSLTQGRVRHLLVDAESPDGVLSAAEDDLVEAALRTSADVTPLEGDAAELLREHGGVAALLRY
jgi:hypothetical protein